MSSFIILSAANSADTNWQSHSRSTISTIRLNMVESNGPPWATHDTRNMSCRPCHRRTQTVCIFVGHVNQTKSQDKLYAPYFIHFGFQCLDFRPSNMTTTCSLAIMFTSVTNKNTNATKSKTKRPTKNPRPTT